MNKSELVDKLSHSQHHLTADQTKKAVEAILDMITKELKDGHRIELRGFGTFSIRTPKTKGTKLVRNPRTGETLTVKSTNKVYYRAGHEVKEKLKGMYKQTDLTQIQDSSPE